LLGLGLRGKKIRTQELLRYFKNLKESVISWKNWWFFIQLFGFFHVSWELWLYTRNVSLIHNFLGLLPFFSIIFHSNVLGFSSMLKTTMQLLFFTYVVTLGFDPKNFVLDPKN
jgi:hypothetical protein